MDEFFKKIKFPYSDVRPGQDEFIKQVYETIEKKSNIIVSAPTGLGKTISGILPALNFAKQNKMSVVVLTSRQTQANQVIKTIKDISNEYAKDKSLKEDERKINYLAFIGKRNMCCHEQRDLYPASDFNDFCKKMKETGKCRYYKNIKNEENDLQIQEIIKLSSSEFMNVEGFVNLSSSNGFCPYELAARKAYQADVVICDYNYMFASGIRETFLGKVGRDLDNTILIIDEAHNLPDRIRSSYSYTLSSELIKNALKELKDFVKSSEYDKYVHNLQSTIDDIYFDKILGDKTEYLMKKDEFLTHYLGKFDDDVKFQDIVEKLFDISREVKEERVISFVGRVAAFLDKWTQLDEESYLRVLEKTIGRDSTYLTLTIKCIDPSGLAADVINNVYASVLMSATLSPITMYRDILGVNNCAMLELDSPFTKKNQLTLVIDDVTTKYTHRTPEMYQKQANHISSLLNAAHGKNAIVFFPSYALMDKIVEKVQVDINTRDVLQERRYMTKEEKENFVEDFKDRSIKSKVLFAVTSGSFAEGLDLPDDSLEMVIVVGLPLGMPDLYVKEVIAHFDKKFKKGQMYGYINPAMNKIIQAAGRCIRTENDKGVVVLMDQRFLWTMYAQNFPKHWKLTRARDYKFTVSNFFDEE